jgi:hypothetical protein
MPGVRPTDQFIGVDRRVFEDCIARAIAAARLGRPAVIPKVCRNPVPMTLPDAIAQCHVRSSIFRIADPARMYAKNHFLPLLERIPADQHDASDWLEHDPREGSEQAWLDFTRTAPPAMDREAVEHMIRISRGQYPEIIQAARWMDEDNGTPHFQPGVGFIIDDPEGLTVPARWVEYLPTIEAALVGLDHERPHPEDVDTLAWLVREGKEPTLYESAAHCFVSGEHTPVTIMANSSRELWIANRFFNERFEGWAFDPAADFPVAPSATTNVRSIISGIVANLIRPESDDEHLAVTKTTGEIVAILSTLSADAIRQGEGLPQNVASLVIAAREAFDTGMLPDEEQAALDKALESFASAVPYANEPDTPASHASDGGEA